MPSPKSGTACSLVPPVSPNTAQEADQTHSGKYGSVPVKPYKSANGTNAKDQPKHWIEIQLLDEMGKPVPGEPYQITLADGSVASGSTDGQGLARVDGLDPGSCQITFPKRDQEAWAPL